MIRRAIVILIVCVSIVLVTSFTSYAQQMSYSVNAGISKAVGDGSEDWNLGFCISGNGFYPVTPNILIGGRIAYNRWTPNIDRIEENEPSITWDASGSATIIEIVPSLRLTAPTSETQTVNFFGQLGTGFFLLNMDAKITGTDNGNTYDLSADRSESKFGISLGGGLIIGKTGSKRFEILPLYHIIFTKDESTKYYSLNIGILL